MILGGVSEVAAALNVTTGEAAKMLERITSSYVHELRHDPHRDPVIVARLACGNIYNLPLVLWWAKNYGMVEIKRRGKA